MNNSKTSIFGKDAHSKLLLLLTLVWFADRQKSFMGSVGQQMLSGQYGNMLGVHSQNKKGESFNNLLMELEMEIAETRYELEFCKKEVK